ncbi:MAG: T9SS type A sorting domain-containing protein [Bacteroidales bacterium]|nr:T9SS type A sorting domain-containing protein [Bacteroidales bacterium]
MKKNYPVILLLSAFYAVRLSAQPGSLDKDFNIDGRETSPITTGNDEAHDIVVQPDGKILLAGTTFMESTFNDFGMIRYNSNGTLDNSFKSTGKLIKDIGTRNDGIMAAALQPDGKIIVAGYSLASATNNDFVIARFNGDGTIDNSFSEDGIQTTDFDAKSDWIMDLAIQKDGKIVAAGYSLIGSTYAFSLVRYNTDGTLDNTFDSDGKVLVFIENSNHANSIAIQPDGKIVVAGYSYTSETKNDFTLIRLNTNGSMDDTFGLGGKVRTPLSQLYDEINSIVIQPDGKILAVGSYSNSSSDKDFAVARYNKNGTIDNTFGSDGIVIRSFGTGADVATGIILQPDGKIVAGGYMNNGSDNDFAIIRYNSNGTPDNSFGTNGSVSTAIGTGNDIALSIGIQPDGKILMAGYCNNGTNNDFAVVRYLSGLIINDLDFKLCDNSLLIYPNPVEHETTLEYNLMEDNVLTICLFDMHGKLITTFLESEKQKAGKHQHLLKIPEMMPPGNYILSISSPNGIVNIKVIK